MRLPRPRFTLRQQLVVIAALAVALGVLIKPLWDSIRWGRVARYHLNQSQVYASRMATVGTRDPSFEELLGRYRWHQSMAGRYARAVAYPGMPPPVG
jgi:hypothetical protein